MMSSGEETFLATKGKASSSDAEKVRRLNANMIERRRMQNINVGFSSLKKILPPLEKKQTKAAVLQQAVQHILRLQRAIVQVKTENSLLREHLLEKNSRICNDGDCPCLAAKKVFGEIEKTSQKPSQVKYRKLIPYPTGAGPLLGSRWPSVVPSEKQVLERTATVALTANPSRATPRSRSELSLKVRERARETASEHKAKRAKVTESEATVQSNSLQYIVDAISIVESKEHRKKA